MITPARFSSAVARRLSLQALGGQVGARKGGKLRRLLEASPADRQAYDQLAILFAALEDRPLGEGQRRRILDEVLLQTGAAARPRLRLPGGVAVQLAAAASLLIVVLGAILALRPPVATTLQPRGSLAPLRPHLAAVRAFCVRRGSVVPPPPRSASTDPDARCRLDDELQLMITHTARYPQLLVIGDLEEASGERRLLWYYPVPPTGESTAAPQGLAAPHPLGRAIRLAVNHRPGRLRIVAVFSRAPLRAETIFAYLRALPDRGSAEELLARIAGGPAELTSTEQRVIIDVPPRPGPRSGHGNREPGVR
jgi:hypothetical protein